MTDMVSSDHVQVWVEELSSRRRILLFDCDSQGCARRATHQVVIEVDSARFEVPACAEHGELVRQG